MAINNGEVIIQVEESGSDHFRGEYPTLIALQSAVPTANEGDYATVKAVGIPVVFYLWDTEDGWVQSGGSPSLTNGNGTTANGSAVDLGGALNKPTTIDAGTHGLVIKYDDGGFGIGIIEWAPGSGLLLRQTNIAGTTTELNFSTFDGTLIIQTNDPGFPGLKYFGNFSANYEDDSLPAWRDVKAYADALIVGLLDDRGNYSASGNTFPSSGGSGTAGAIKKGDLWTISVAGTLGGVAVTAGDAVRALIDTPGQTASNWVVTENNIGYVPQQQNNNLTALSGLTGSAGQVPYFTGAGAMALIALDGDKGDVTVSSTGTIWSIDVNINKAWTGTHSFKDSNFTILNNADNTKILALDLSGFTTGTTRTITIPNGSGTIALLNGLAGTQTFTITSIFNTGVTLSGPNGGSSATISGSKTVTSNSIAGELNIAGTVTARATASDTVYSTLLNTTLVANAATQTLSGIGITPAYTVGAHAPTLIDVFVAPTFSANTYTTHYAWKNSSGFIAWDSVLSPPQITSDQNDYNPTGWTNGGAPHGAMVVRLTSDASRNITSLAAGVSGRIALLANVDSFNKVIPADDGSTGTAANRFATGFTIPPGEVAMILYDGVSNRWRKIN